MIAYRQAGLNDAGMIAELGLLLYGPDNTFESLRADAEEHISSGKWAIFLAFDENTPVGLCEIALRSDYVEGTEGGTVGYVEGVFIKEAYRGGHIARTLLSLGENWSRESGCAEFASDCDLENTSSLKFHLRAGFEEAGRNIHFVKKL